MTHFSRREFLQQVAPLGVLTLTAGVFARPGFAATPEETADIAFGMVTYQWGRDWDLPTLIRNCTTARVLGVELRTTHAHRVEPNLTAGQRKEVKKRFQDSPVQLVGLGSAEEFHSPDPGKLKRAIENTKAFIRLSHDVGGSGVKVRPNDLPRGVPSEKTIEQIGKALNVVGEFGAGFGQQIRLEVHGGCARLSIIRQIMDVATHPNVGVCWNSNDEDLRKPGLESNFNLVKNRLGATTHVRQLDIQYPFRDLMKLFWKANYRGWWLLEAGGKDPPDRVKALAEQRQLFDDYLAAAKLAG
ncbi:MAG: sugar phosphate isomerase/epimerase family protein [Thermoguttaceae bacterium]